MTELRRILAEARKRGWADEVELITDGLQSAAAAAFDHNGRPVAALSSTWRRRFSGRQPDVVGHVLREGAERLTAQISGRSPDLQTG